MFKKFLKSLKISFCIITFLYLTSFLFTINITPSMPKGIYFIYPVFQVKKGDK